MGRNTMHLHARQSLLASTSGRSDFVVSSLKSMSWRPQNQQVSISERLASGSATSNKMASGSHVVRAADTEMSVSNEPAAEVSEVQSPPRKLYNSYRYIIMPYSHVMLYTRCPAR